MSSLDFSHIQHEEHNHINIKLKELDKHIYDHKLIWKVLRYLGALEYNHVKNK